MRTLTAIGFWKNKSDLVEKDFPSPLDLIKSDLNEEEKHKVLSYLRSGQIVEEYLGTSFCRFKDGPSDEAMGNKDLSDGIYVWPEGYHVYVDKLDIAIPTFFVNHMRGNSYVVPAVDEALLSEGFNTNYDEWHKWTKNNMLPLLTRVYRKIRLARSV